MARYFFNVHDGRDIVDDEGSELASLAEVREEALRATVDLLRDVVTDNLWSGHEWRMVVVDSAGLEVLTLRFSASQPGR